MYRSPAPLWEGTALSGYVAVAPFEGEMQHTTLSDGRHVEFLMLIPAFPEELDYALRHGVAALSVAQEQAGVPCLRTSGNSWAALVPLNEPTRSTAR
ncbi:suppressor of fused domain protein [Streptomyces sp. NPDC051582]|uniref:suppressor of fused domain protein n=1 Tax=Streptomyces sp. NPDC051582 TaxID=3155167 RepID=UPI00343B1B8E